ncbi:hypothetical protein WJX81_003836 [Elliptochloris bilobata]|uniref:UBX domain-containing protein n=1 Tax=Elliptochloris bilobata TaxID=381761 RepID=A0AAW1SC03_9CHLO
MQALTQLPLLSIKRVVGRLVLVALVIATCVEFLRFLISRQPLQLAPAGAALSAEDRDRARMAALQRAQLELDSAVAGQAELQRARDGEASARRREARHAAASAATLQQRRRQQQDAACPQAPEGSWSAQEDPVRLEHERRQERRAQAQAARQQLREEQDAAFAATLREDQAVQAREQEAAAAAAASAAAVASSVAAAAERTQRLLQQRAEARASLPAQPQPGAPGTVTVAVRLPDAAVVRRRFSAEADTAAVYAWLSCLEEFPHWEAGTWALVTAFPRARLPKRGATLAEANVVEGGGALLIVEQL